MRRAVNKAISQMVTPKIKGEVLKGSIKIKEKIKDERRRRVIHSYVILIMILISKYREIGRFILHLQSVSITLRLQSQSGEMARSDEDMLEEDKQ